MIGLDRLLTGSVYDLLACRDTRSNQCKRKPRPTASQRLAGAFRFGPEVEETSWQIRLPSCSAI